MFGPVPRDGLSSLMRVDFYQLSRDSAEAVLPLIAERTLAAGERLLAVSGDDAQLARLAQGLWERGGGAFLANGFAGSAHDPRQPILLSDRAEAANGAAYLALADGVWRDEAASFARVFLLFGAETIEAARRQWRALDAVDGAERHYWEQGEGGKWEQRA